MLTMRHHIIRINKALSKKPAEARMVHYTAQKDDPGVLLMQALLEKEFAEDIADIERKYQVSVEWVPLHYLDTRMPALAVKLGTGNPFLTAYNEATGGAETKVDPRESIGGAISLFCMSGKRLAGTDKLLYAFRIRQQFDGCQAQTLEDLIAKQLDAFWQKLLGHIDEVVELYGIEERICEAIGKEDFEKFLGKQALLFGAATPSIGFFTGWDLTSAESRRTSVYNTGYAKKIIALADIVREQKSIIR